MTGLAGRGHNLGSEYSVSAGTLKVAFLGDVNGVPGRNVILQRLDDLRNDHDPDVLIANGENIRSGSGITPDLYNWLRGRGIDAVTLGDHVYRDQRILPQLEDSGEPIARPANLSGGAAGKRLIRIPLSDGRALWVFTLLGRIFVNLPANDPFSCADELLDLIPEQNPLVVVEVHMEATSEKAALAHHLDGRVAAVLGTHTHVPTADARVLAGGTAFITDVGMCGPYDSVIGRKKEAVLQHMRTGMHAPFDMASGGESMCGCIVTVRPETGLAVSIERVQYDADYSRTPFK
ncbi:MAG: TIGR00282 family metallophosphoesterase [Planctomycetota bacterium]|nr:TIGR00282 family metallophosphoesterase [Planctomycetota bacterium]